MNLTLPPELTSRETALAYLGIGERELKKIWYYRGSMYHQFTIAERSKQRIIHAPDSRLKFIQRRIADTLMRLYQPRNPVHGYVKDRSVKTNALAHKNRLYILNLDLKSFFPTIRQHRVRGLFISLGMTCEVADILSHLSCLNHQLPQGSPCSPIISNMMCFKMDRALMALAKDARCIYTRYSDDITFSSFRPPLSLFEGGSPPAGRLSAGQLSPTLLSVIDNNGFFIHPDKIHYADKNSRRSVNGIKTNKFLNVDRTYIRKIRAILYSVETMGMKAAQSKFEKITKKSCDIQLFVRGKISYLMHIKGPSDPVVRGIVTRYNRLFPDHVIHLCPSDEDIRDRAVWIIDNDATDEQSTAVFVKGHGLVTAQHCVKNTEYVEIYHHSKTNEKYIASVISSDDHRDLAILSHDIPINNFLELDPCFILPEKGLPVVALGYPEHGPGDGMNVRHGTVAGTRMRSGVKLVEVTQPLVQGMSGGPIINGSNQVIGIIHRGGHGEARHYATRIEELFNLPLPGSPTNPAGQ